MRGAWAVGVGVAAVCGVVWGQPPAAGPAARADRYMSDQRVRTNCLDCHLDPRPGAIAQGSDKFILLHETKLWQEHDLHRRAFDALTSPLGQRMSRVLHDGDANAAAKSPACLVCHATDTNPELPLTQKTATGFNCELGINCQVCHGPAEGWVGLHNEAEKWRTRSPTDKGKLGLVPLRDPVVRAGKCVGCHVGSAADGKFVTHEMYAAGHPPLPAFELASFSRDEPRHWRPAKDVPVITALPPEKARELFSYRKGEVEAARLVAVGAVVSFRESVRLLAWQRDPDRAPEALDFAHFNCTACHHDLRVPSDRQRDGFAGPPGRPVPQTWPVWLVRAVLRHAEIRKHPEAAALRAEFEETYGTLRAEFGRVPFGDRAKVLAAKAALEATCDRLLRMIDALEYTEAAAVSLLEVLAAEAQGRRRDFLDADAAAQFARAFAAVHSELGGSTSKGLAETLKELDKTVPLVLRDRRENGVGTDGKLLPNHAEFLIQHEQLGRRLKLAAEFKPDAFRTRFAELAGHLGGQK